MELICYCQSQVLLIFVRNLQQIKLRTFYWCHLLTNLALGIQGLLKNTDFVFISEQVLSKMDTIQRINKREMYGFEGFKPFKSN